MPFWIGFGRVCGLGARDKRHPVLACSNADNFEYFWRHVRETAASAGLKDLLNRKSTRKSRYFMTAAAPRGQINTIGWAVREFVLVDSWVRLTRHEILGR
jgi:hypothetical protein